MATNLDITQVAPKYLKVGTIGAGGGVSTPLWECTLTRKSATSSYGPYTVRFTQEGSTPARRPCNHVQCQADICPMGN